ncbi:LysR family transcriptional regulator [Shewanella youngdeokensis]|uniref:LysR family transcriptional regulator n=1 Tax=Shewanella youngdeokensis TaxID=2999068 RepID=A0ABZ0JZP6_9GAMM|nr:LysR family transcriptional regulator [Shewanella sp. DAU334]
MLKQISRLDYFTLQVFIGLIELKNGGAVADKLRTTQSKVSRALTTMREVLGDELFLRHKSGFEPNPVALKISPMVQDIVQQFDNIIEATSDKQSAAYELSVAANEYWSLMVLNCIQQSCQCYDNGVHVNVQPYSDTVSQRLCQGKIDCSISTSPINHSMVSDVKIGDATHCFIVAKQGHPILSSSQPLEDIFKYKIALDNVNLQGHQMHCIEKYAQSKHIDIRVALKSPNLDMLIDHVSETNDVSIMTSVMAYNVFKNRQDVSFVDISDQCRKAGFSCNSYYLHCHQTVAPKLADCLSRLLSEKLLQLQDDYNSTYALAAPIKRVVPCCAKSRCSAPECDAAIDGNCRFRQGFSDSVVEGVL